MRHLTRLLLPAVVFVLTLGGVTAPVQAGREQGDGRPVAANSTARPFKGSASGEVEFVEDDACASGLRAEYSVPGRASHLGRVQVIGSHCASDDPTGEFTMVAANGDQLTATYAPVDPGVQACVYNDSFTEGECTMKATVIGGTGRFDAASGSFTVTVHLPDTDFDKSVWPAVWTWTGSLDYAVRTNSVTLSIATFSEFGYEDLITEYEELNPNVTIEHVKAATESEARDNLIASLAAGSGASDIEAIEVDWLPELLQHADEFVDLSDPSVEGRWFDWKVAPATTPDGKLIAYGTDIGPEGICYRADLFANAGLPTDRDEVAELLGGDGATWNTYFEVGNEFMAADTGPAWFDSAGGVYQAMINQVENAYEQADGTIIALDNPEVRSIYDSVLEAAVDDNQSKHVNQWSEDWIASFQTDGFATMQCPSWMLGIIEGQAAGVEGWDIADVFPGGGGNWGGSFLTVPAMGTHQAEAKALANWLTAPEQQLKAFLAQGTFPSQVAALTDPTLLSQTNEFFNDAPTGQILANRASAVTVAPFKGPNYFAISDAMQRALTRVDVDKTHDAASSWTEFEDDVQALG